jgi:signal transduction histidine kinase
LRLRSLRVRERLILLFVLVAGLPLGVAGLLITQEARRALETRIASENEALARAVGLVVEDEGKDAIRILHTAALSPNIRGPLEARDIPGLEAQLKRIRDAFKHFDAVWVLDPEGTQLASFPPVVALRGRSFASREYYKAVVSSREPLLSPGFRRSPPPHDVTSAAAVPITDGKDHLLGVLVAALDLSRLESQIRLAMGAGPYRIVLLDRTGRALIHPEPAYLLQFPPAETPGNARELGSRVLLRDVGWTLTVSQPAAMAFAPLAQLEGAIVWALLVAVIGAGALAFVVAARFTRPIEALRRDVTALAADEAAEEAGGGDELSSLRREFDRMRASIAEQAQTVEARTGALEALLDIASTLNASLDLDTILGQALERTMAIAGADLGGIRLYDAGRGVLDSICTRGDWWRAADRPATRRLGEGLSGRVAEMRAPIYLSGDAADLGALAATEGARAAAAIPLLAHDHLQGTLLLCYRHPHEFTDQERQLLAGIGTEIGTALENARLYGEALEKTERLGGLIRTSAKVAGSLQTGELLRDIAEEAAKLLRVEGAGFRLLEGDRLVLGGRYGLAHHVMLSPSLPVGESLTGRVAQEGRPIALPDLREDQSMLPEHKASALTHGVVATLGVPLRYRDRIIGVLNVYGKERRTFHEGEIGLLSAFADHAAIALENARLFALSQRRLERAQALFETGRAVGGTLNLAGLFDLIIAKTVEHLRVGKCALFLAEVQGGEMALTYEAGWGLSPSFIADDRQGVGEGTTGKAVLLRRPVWTADILNDPAISLSPRLRALIETEGYRAVLSAPILAQGEPIGALVVYRDKVGPFGDEEVEFLQSLANQAGSAIHNAQLFADLRGQTERLGSLIGVSRLIGSSLELQHVLTTIVRTCTELLGMDAASLSTLDEREGILEAQVDYGLTEVESRTPARLEVGAGFAGRVLAERRVLVSADFAEDPRVADRAWARREGLVAAAGIPLLVGDKALGVLAIFNRSPRSFSEADMTLLSSFASQAAIALENARLFAALKEHSDQLEERVRERTAELEKANRAKSQFLANMSHELRTPLNAIIGFSALLAEGVPGPLTAKQRRHVGHIQTSGQHLLAVINDILDLSKVEAGKMTLTLQPVDLGQVVQESLTLVRGEAAAKGLRLEAAVPADLPPVLADRIRLKQILSNLLSNAVKFTPEAGAVTVGARAAEEGLAIWVQDTGVGIAPEDQERIFREFEQADNSLGRQHQGAGLGLALTRKLVELHGGRVWVESAPGQGSAFTFTLPAAEVGAGQAPQATAGEGR